MHAFLAIGRLCCKNWKTLILWALSGPLVIALYGTGSFHAEPFDWGRFIGTGVIFGIFIGSLVTVNQSRRKKNQSLKTIDRDIKKLSERELHIAFSILAIIFGAMCAGLLQLALAEYLVFTAIFLFLAFSRNVIEKLLV